MATESSVVVALREVRRLEIERQKREEEARMRAHEEERAHEEAARRASIQYEQGMSPYGNGNGGNGQSWGQGAEGQPESFSRPMRRTTEVVPVATNGGGYGDQAFVQVGPWDNALSAPPQRRRGSLFKAVLVTMILCGAGAAAGYWRLNQDFIARENALKVERDHAQEGRNDAVAARSKIEQELKLKITELETKLTTAQAKATAVSSALAQAAAAAATVRGEPVKPAPLGKAFLKKGHGKAAWGKAAGGSRIASRAPVAAPKPEPVKPAAAVPGKSPKMAKKKAVTDDPLGGLRL